MYLQLIYTTLTCKNFRGFWSNSIIFHVFPYFVCYCVNTNKAIKMRQFSFFELVPSNVTLKVQIKKLFLSFFCFIFDLEVVVILWSFAIGSRNEPTIYSAPSSIYKSTNCACFSIVSILTLLLYNNFAASLHIWWYSVICNGKLNAYVSAFIN